MDRNKFLFTFFWFCWSGSKLVVAYYTCTVLYRGPLSSVIPVYFGLRVPPDFRGTRFEPGTCRALSSSRIHRFCTGVKASFKMGLKGEGYDSYPPTPILTHFKAGYNFRTGSMNLATGMPTTYEATPQST
jgi:hypothetical protein